MGSLLTLGASVGMPLALGQVMGLWSSPDVVDWFPRLRKPRWTPPRWFFPPVWATLYAVMGVAAHRVWLAGGGPLPLGLYTLQLALNLAWQPLFFKAHNLRAAAYDITALLGVLGATIWQFTKYDPLAAQLMVPYAAFSAFAAALTYDIRFKNGDKVE